MNELSTTEKHQLPQTIEEKTAYVLFGSDALNAYRKKLKAVQTKYGISSEQYKQIQLEAQETAENLLMFSVDIGKEISKINGAQGSRTDLQLPEVDRKKLKTKTEAIHDMGFTASQARDFQTMAKYPQSVKRAIEDARKHDRIVTRQDVFNDIANTEYPTRKQREAQELREAKHRVEDFGDAKVIAIGDAKQNTKDKQLLFKEFLEKVQKARTASRHIIFALDEEATIAAIKAADKRDLIKLQDELQEDHRRLVGIQRRIVEVIDEK